MLNSKIKDRRMEQQVHRQEKGESEWNSREDTGPLFALIAKERRRTFLTMLITYSSTGALQGVVVAKVQDPALGLAEPRTVGFGPSMQPVQVSLQNPLSFQQIDTPSQPGVIYKFADGYPYGHINLQHLLECQMKEAICKRDDLLRKSEANFLQAKEGIKAKVAEVEHLDSVVKKLKATQELASQDEKLLLMESSLKATQEQLSEQTAETVRQEQNSRKSQTESWGT
ncbi:hypothetical protein WISP_88141 [Willisornis vidua]|uniref:Uncharacterized protein n=1 Tax=Willisornis vidua TaxID=1566151 RepID=A0ABQ9D2C9_9PASS|nr:hypothetical protein WISP_88141 [Willisornis vidua]